MPSSELCQDVRINIAKPRQTFHTDPRVYSCPSLLSIRSSALCEEAHSFIQTQKQQHRRIDCRWKAIRIVITDDSLV